MQSFRRATNSEFLSWLQIMHVRSRSRVGYGDMGVNRARVEKIRTLIKEFRA